MQPVGSFMYDEKQEKMLPDTEHPSPFHRTPPESYHLTKTLCSNRIGQEKQPENGVFSLFRSGVAFPFVSFSCHKRIEKPHTIADTPL